MRVSVASSGWCSWLVKQSVLLAFSQIKHWEGFTEDIFLSNIQLCWSRSWNEVLRHVENWILLLLNEVRSLLKWCIGMTHERCLLAHLASEGRPVVVLHLLALEE